MKRQRPTICACPACQQLDRAHPNEGQQIAMFGPVKRRNAKTNVSRPKIAN